MTATRMKPFFTFIVVITLHLGAAGAPAAQEAGRIHVLFVVDTQGLNVAGVNQVPGYTQMMQLVGSLRAGRENRITWNLLQGAEATPANVLNYYQRGLPDFQPTDSLLFFYWGHGGWDATQGPSGDEKGHYLGMKGGCLYRSQLRMAMLARRPYGVFIITDCCSSIPNVEPPHRANGNFPPVAAVPPAGRPQWETFRNLFFQHRGLVDVTAASRGEYGWGCFFTTALPGLLTAPRSSLRNDGRDGFVTWAEFFPRLQYRTYHLFVKSQSDIAAARLPYAKDPATGKLLDVRLYAAQTAFAFYLGDLPELQRYLRVVNNTRETVTLHVWFYAFNPTAGQWQWLGGAAGYSFTLAPGQATYLWVGQWKGCGNGIQYRFDTPTRKWQAAPLVRPLVAPEGYRKLGDLATANLVLQ